MCKCEELGNIILSVCDDLEVEAYENNKINGSLEYTKSFKEIENNYNIEINNETEEAIINILLNAEEIEDIYTDYENNSFILCLKEV